MTRLNTDHVADATTGQPPSVNANYQYWRDHGHEWVEHYDFRKTRMVLYHIQELMLTTYVEQHAAAMMTRERRPLRVLEFGCGVGRHLRNLSKLPNVDVHGFDQSDTMVQGILRWAPREWFDAHVHVGSPTGPLPFETEAFDLVYSAEVLVHVRPEDLEGRLSEMLRVSRGHVLHLETSPDFPLVSGEHSGCWRHDLSASYMRLGRSCEVLPRGYECHTPFRVVVGEHPSWTWPEQILAMYRRMERDIDAGFTALESANRAHEATIQSQASAAETLNATISSLQRAVVESEALLAEKDRGIDLVNTWLADAQVALKAEVAKVDDLSRRLEFWSSENEKLRSQYAELAAARDAAMNEISALRHLIARVQQGWETDRAIVMSLLDQRRKFIETATRTLDRKDTTETW